MMWRTHFKTKTRNFLDSNSKVKEVSTVNDYYVYEILNYNDGKLSNDSLVKYNRLFKESLILGFLSLILKVNISLPV